MHGMTFQDTITVRGTSVITSVVQSEDLWLNTSAVQDMTFWLLVTAVNNSGGAQTLLYETSPAKEEVFFKPMAALTPTVSATPLVTPVLLSAAIPPASFTRWRISSTNTRAWDITFKIYVALNILGR